MHFLDTVSLHLARNCDNFRFQQIFFHRNGKKITKTAILTPLNLVVHDIEFEKFTRYFRCAIIVSTDIHVKTENFKIIFLSEPKSCL